MKKQILYVVLILLIGVCISSEENFAQEEQEDRYTINPTLDTGTKSGVYVPIDLEDSFRELEKMLHPDLIKEMRNGTEKDMLQYHFDLGMWIRNNWELWRAGRLAKYFNSIGIHHADDMSNIILDTFWCYLNNKPFRLEERIALYTEYWRVVTPPKKGKCPQDASIFRIKISLDAKTEDGKPRVIHVGRCKKRKHLWVYETDKGWYKPSDEILQRISNAENR